MKWVRSLWEAVEIFLAKRAAEAFIADTPEYVRSHTNADRMINYLLDNNLRPTKNNFKKAFQHIRGNE